MGSAASIISRAARRSTQPDLACTGNSGGGTLTSYLMALDDRVAVAAPSCYITSLERLFTTIGPQDGEQNVVGQVANGIDHADYILMRAPKPTLLCVGTRDFFDIQGSWDTFQEVEARLRQARASESASTCSNPTRPTDSPGLAGKPPPAG